MITFNKSSADLNESVRRLRLVQANPINATISVSVKYTEHEL